MSEFFRGWRRKTGCLTLVLALVGMSGWVRSYIAVDKARIPFQTSMRIVGTGGGCLHLCYANVESPGSVDLKAQIAVSESENGKQSYFILFYKLPRHFHWETSDPTSEKRVANFDGIFKGWRRKAGLVTLLVTIVFAGLWVTSYWYNGQLLEVVRRQNQRDDHRRLYSLPGEIVWTNARNLNFTHSFLEFFGSMSLGDDGSPYFELTYGIPIN